MGGLLEKDNIIEFKCMPEKCLFNSENFKIYSTYVNTEQYPNIKVSPKYKTAVIVGDIPDLTLSVEYEVKAIEEKSKYGPQYQIRNLHRPKPNTLEGTKIFLYEFLTKNQADVLLAEYPNIVDKIMNNDLDDIDLNRTKGVKEYTFNVIKKKIIENFKLTELVQEYNGIFSLSILRKLYETYTALDKIRTKLQEEPYTCLCKLNRIGFKTADKLLLKTDKESKKNIKEGKKPIIFFNDDLKTSYQRMKACSDYILDENENNGHTHMHVMEYKRKCEVLAKEAISHLPAVIKGEDVYFDKKTLRIAKKSTYEVEQYIANKIIDGLNIEGKVWDIDVEKYRNLKEFELTDEQIQTLENVCKYQISIMNGNSGSGKTSSTEALIKMLESNKKSYRILAPTGRAAKVIANYTNREATTIHRGLMYQPPDKWGYNKECPLVADIVIVDEVSMIDVFLLKHLLEAINFAQTKILFIGDDAQIPSVGCGNILYDLLNSNIIPTVTLSKIFRYGEGGLMTVATDTRNSKQYLDKENNGLQVFGDDKSYVFISIEQEKIVDSVVAIYKKLLSQGYKVEDIGVLSCYNKGDYGTAVINQKLQEVVNGVEETKIKYGDKEYRLNDLVMQTVNEYKALSYPDEEGEMFVANGEIGKVIAIDNCGMAVDFDGMKIYYPKGNMGSINLSYSLSVHKCVHEDTLLYTNKGILPIKSIMYDPTIKVYNGFEMKHPIKFIDNGKEDVFEILTERGYRLRATKEHESVILSEEGEFVKIKTNQLQKGQIMILRKGCMLQSDYNDICFDTKTYTELSTKFSNEYSLPNKMTKEFARFLGYLVADGTIRHSGITLAKRHLDVVEDFVRISKIIFGRDFEIIEKNKNLFLVNISSTQITDFLISNIDGIMPNDKFVPTCIMESSIEYQKEFLKSLFEDGGVGVKFNGGKWRFDNVNFCFKNDKMLNQLQVLLLNIGIIATWRKRKKDKYTQNFCYIYGDSAREYEKQIGFISKMKNDKLELCKDIKNLSKPELPMELETKLLSVLESNNFTCKELAVMGYERKVQRSYRLTKIMFYRIYEKMPLEIKNISIVQSCKNLLDNFYFEKIESITNIGESNTYCLEMNNGMFVQDGILSGNSQGGSFKIVIYITPKAHTFMINNNLNYVALTRAREKCYHLGDVITINRALKKKENFDRRTFLKDLLIEGKRK